MVYSVINRAENCFLSIYVIKLLFVNTFLLSALIVPRINAGKKSWTFQMIKYMHRAVVFWHIYICTSTH